MESLDGRKHGFPESECGEKNTCQTGTLFCGWKIKLFYFKPLKFWGVLAIAIITLITLVVAPKLSYDKLNYIGQITSGCKEPYASLPFFILYTYRTPKDT